MMGRIGDDGGVAGVSIEGPGVPGRAASSCSTKSDPWDTCRITAGPAASEFSRMP